MIYPSVSVENNTTNKEKIMDTLAGIQILEADVRK